MQVDLHLRRRVLGVGALEGDEPGDGVDDLLQCRVERVVLLQGVGLELLLQEPAVAVEQVELQLDPHPGPHPQRGEPFDDALQNRSW